MTELNPNVPPISGPQKAWAAFIIGVLIAVATAIAGAIVDGWSAADTWMVIIVALGAVGSGLGVYRVPNKPAQVSPADQV